MKSPQDREIPSILQLEQRADDSKCGLHELFYTPILKVPYYGNGQISGNTWEFRG